MELKSDIPKNDMADKNREKRERKINFDLADRRTEESHSRSAHHTDKTSCHMWSLPDLPKLRSKSMCSYFSPDCLAYVPHKTFDAQIRIFNELTPASWIKTKVK